jgi:redox-sensitive bicupin YhaK (pirin superfamily)
VSASVELRHASDRFVTATRGVTSRHAFSFGHHYDAANTSFGLLVAHNDDVLEPGAGYPEHGHREVDIVSWVAEGSLRHTDDHGGVEVVPAGEVQLLVAGSGVRHAEINAGETPTRFVQMWVAPTVDGSPAYGTVRHAGTGFVPLASGRSPAPLTLRAPATFAVARLHAGEKTELEGAAFVHLSTIGGRVTVAVHDLSAVTRIVMDDGDTARITAATAITVTADRHGEGSEREGVDVLAWLMETSPAVDLHS